MIRWEFLRSFARVVEHRSFAGAARQLGITPAAVAKQIGLLEQSVGFQLLSRSTRGLSLTKEGTVFYTQFLRILEEMKEAEMLTFALKGKPKGRLKVASSVDFGEHYIMPFLKEFMTTYPDLSLEIKFSDSIPDFDKEKIDLLVGITSGVPDFLIQKKMMETEYVLCASQQYLDSYGVPTHPENLKNHKIINHSNRKPSSHVLWFDHGLDIAIEPYLLMNTTRSLLLAAKSGLGIVYLHHYVVEESLANGSLVPLLRNYTKTKFPIHYFYKPTRYPLPSVIAFTEFLNYRIKKSSSSL